MLKRSDRREEVRDRPRPAGSRRRRRIKPLLLAAAVAVCTAALLAGWPAGAAAVHLANGVVLAPAGFHGRAMTLARLIEARGARVDIVFAPRAAVAYVGTAEAARLRAAGFTVLRAGASAPRGDAQLRRALDLVDALARGASASALPPKGGLPSFGADLRGPLGRAAGEAPSLAAMSPLGAISSLPTATEPMAFGAGSVAVGIIFPQSDGVIDPSIEDWNKADPANPGDRRTNVVTRIGLTLEWWRVRAPGGILHFVIPASGQPGAPQTVATQYEPITHATYSVGGTPTDSDQCWRWDIMGQLLGTTPTSHSPLPETAYDDLLRHEAGTDWAVTVYVVDSLATPTGQKPGEFPDGLFAYTYDLFGPYAVTTYGNDSYEFSRYDVVLAHEFGHLFGALDEYAPPDPGYPSTGDLTSGYLGVRNSNAVRGGTTRFPCIMRGGKESLAAYALSPTGGKGGWGGICPATRGQDGWRTSRKGAPADVVDTHPGFRDAPQRVGADHRVTVTGTVRETPWPRGVTSVGDYFGHDISIFVPHDMAYRVDGGAWQSVSLPSGQSQAPFTIVTDPLSDGHHALDVRATTGTTAGITRYLWIGDTPVKLGLTGTRSVVYGHRATLTVTSTSGGFPVPYLSGVTIGRVGTVVRSFTTDGAGVWQGKPAPAFTITYVARFAGHGQFLGPARSALVTVAVQPLVTLRRSLYRASEGLDVVVSGGLRPANPGAVMYLDVTRDGGRSWHAVARGPSDRWSHFVLRYRAGQRGVVRLRARFVGTARNAPATVAIAPFTVR